MHNVEDAVAQLREATGLSSLKLDENGNAAILIDDVLTVYLMKTGDHEFEFATVLDRFDGKLTAYGLRRLAESNVAGSRVEAGRLAIDPSNGKLVYGERVDARDHDVASLQAGLQRFAAAATHWASTDALALLREPAAATEGDADAETDVAQLEKLVIWR